MCYIKINELLTKYHNGEDVLEDIYNLSYKRVFGYLLSISKNYDLAEDLTQETYVSLASSIKRYKDSGQGLTYIFSIAKNLYRNYVRANIKNEYVEDIYVPSNKETLKSEDDLFIESVLAKLDKEEAEIVYLYIIDEFKHKEIAELTSKPLGTVTYIYAKAIKKLRILMEEEENER